MPADAARDAQLQAARGALTKAGGAAPAAQPAPAAPSDEALVGQLRKGEVAAGEVLVRRHYEPLMRYLQRLAGPQVAEELHQQTWLSVLDHIDRFDAGTVGGGFKSWLFRIATNKANDHWRSRGREKAAKEGLKLVTDDELPHAGHRLEGTEQEHKLRRAIEQLPEAQRQVLMLRYYSNMKFVDIAKMLGCPLNTALGRVHKAMIKLRAMMEE
jgi:RNA polymerase sigma factor (sigma-70 family)